MSKSVDITRHSLNRVLIRRITTVTSIRNNKKEVIGYKATCNHGPADRPLETKIYALSQWGEIAYQLAAEWALDHKCNGEKRQENGA